jgi:hypothetical protein
MKSYDIFYHHYLTIRKIIKSKHKQTFPMGYIKSLGISTPETLLLI